MIYLPLLYKLISYNILITFLLGFPQTKYNERQAKLQEAQPLVGQKILKQNILPSSEGTCKVSNAQQSVNSSFFVDARLLQL